MIRTPIISFQYGPYVKKLYVNYGMPSNWAPNVQCSAVANIAIEFSEPVVVDEDAFEFRLSKSGVSYDGVDYTDGYGSVPTLVLCDQDGVVTPVWVPRKIWVLKFSGSDSVVVNRTDGYACLKDGVYEIIVDGSRVIGSNESVDGVITQYPAHSFVDNVVALFGDADGSQQDMNGLAGYAMSTVSTGDNLAFRQAFNNSNRYLPYFDYLGDGVINTGDNLELRTRFGKLLRWNSTHSVYATRLQRIVSGRSAFGNADGSIAPIPVPADCTSAVVECYGGGGAGENGGGGGGAYATALVDGLTPGAPWYARIGQCGFASIAERFGKSTFVKFDFGSPANCEAVGGDGASGLSGGDGGIGADGTGDTTYDGGSGEDAYYTADSKMNGGCGGGCAQNSEDGQDGNANGALLGGGAGANQPYPGRDATLAMPGTRGGGGGGQRSGLPFLRSEITGLAGAAYGGVGRLRVEFLAD